MTKFSAKHYWMPTPKGLRKFGDALLGISTASSLGSVIAYLNTEDEKIKHAIMIYSAVVVIAGTVGKFLTNFFKEDGTPPPTDQP